MRKIAVFDIGGTNIKSGLHLENQGLKEIIVVPTEAYKGGPNVLSKIIARVETIKKNQHLDGIAISSAGQIDPFKGTIIYANGNMPNYQHLEIKAKLKTRFDLKVTVDNDVNCALLAELKKQEQGIVAMFTIGTGIGGALAIDGKLYRGRNFSAGELGYLPLGNQTFEKEASLSALIAKGKKITKNNELTGEELFELENQSSCIQAEIQLFYTKLAQGLAAPILLLDLEQLILGGAITGRRDFLIRLKEKLEELVPKHIIQNVTIKIAENGNNAGMLGAAKWWYAES